jgi:kynurenine formamidase
MVTYKGLPGPHICDYWTREHSAAFYSDGSTFQIGRIDMVANTGTYLDAPFHRFADGADLAALALDQLAGLPGLVVRAAERPGGRRRRLRRARRRRQGGAGPHRLGPPLADRGLLREPSLPDADAARLLADRGARLVGIDSHNIDDTSARSRPVHTILLGAGILVCEHMTNLAMPPDTGFAFTAVPPRIVGMGTFPGARLRPDRRLESGLRCCALRRRDRGTG